MLLLLPPSESKTGRARGAPLDLEKLSFPELTGVRGTLLDALVGLAQDDRLALARALALRDSRSAELDRDARLRTAPAVAAARLYTGVLYESLGLESLSGGARRRASTSLVVASALFGLLRPGDRVPPYRLSGQTILPGIGSLAPLWRPVLEPLLAGRTDLVVDLRSGAYAALARVPQAVQVRVLREADRVRTVVSHDNKWTKGRLARELCINGARTVAHVAEAGRSLADAVEVDGRRVDLVLHGLATSREEPAATR